MTEMQGVEIQKLVQEIRFLTNTLRQTILPQPAIAVPFDHSIDIYIHSMIAPGTVYEPDVYRTYFDHDVALLTSFVDNGITAKPGCFVDFLGRTTRCHYLPSIRHLEGKASASIPIPGDGFYAETIEYIAFLMALDSSRGDTFVAAELGAGWGPWVAAAGVGARRRGVPNVHLIGVEANPGKIEFMKEHLHDNGLRPATPSDEASFQGVHSRCVCAAIWIHDGEVRFPDIDPANEYGAAVSCSEGATDYRGVPVRLTSVPCYTIESLLAEYPVIDFIHIDIQGSESEVCGHSIEFLRERARYIFVATHSRNIEGDLLALFRSSGFELLREKPCRFSLQGAWPGNTEGLIAADGGQIWHNPKFSQH